MSPTIQLLVRYTVTVLRYTSKIQRGINAVNELRIYFLLFSHNKDSDAL